MLTLCSSFHFDQANRGRPCESAYLGIPAAPSRFGRLACVENVTVLVSYVFFQQRTTVLTYMLPCSPNNLQTMTQIYSALPGVSVRPLNFLEDGLRAKYVARWIGDDEEVRT